MFWKLFKKEKIFSVPNFFNRNTWYDILLLLTKKVNSSETDVKKKHGTNVKMKIRAKIISKNENASETDIKKKIREKLI